jgi:DNA invertase Pin-like site-specific DNA recombinase
MARLTLNMLPSFAQFEREVTGERIRDKIAAPERKGLWMEGHVPLGYEASRRTGGAEAARGTRTGEVIEIEEADEQPSVRKALRQNGHPARGGSQGRGSISRHERRLRC